MFDGLLYLKKQAVRRNNGSEFVINYRTSSKRLLGRGKRFFNCFLTEKDKWGTDSVKQFSFLHSAISQRVHLLLCDFSEAEPLCGRVSSARSRGARRNNTCVQIESSGISGVKNKNKKKKVQSTVVAMIKKIITPHPKSQHMLPICFPWAFAKYSRIWWHFCRAIQGPKKSFCIW